MVLCNFCAWEFLVTKICNRLPRTPRGVYIGQWGGEREAQPAKQWLVGFVANSPSIKVDGGGVSEGDKPLSRDLV